MSNAVFPSAAILPGLNWPVAKRPVFDTAVQRAVGGFERRTAWMAYPLWEFEIGFEFLRDRFEIGGSHPPASFARAGDTATRVDSTGRSVPVPAHTPRANHDPVTLALKGLLIEETRSNLLVNSVMPTTSSGWSTDGLATLADGGIAGPMSGYNWAKLTVGSNRYAYQGIALTNGTTYTRSVYCKKGVSADNNLHVRFAGALTIAGCTLNLSTGAISAITGSATVTALGDDEYRVTMTGTATATETGVVDVLISGASVAGDYHYLACEQFEPGGFATSYIPTTTAAVTRNADDASVLLSAISGFSATEGALFAEIITPLFDNGLGAIADLNNDTTSEQIRMILGSTFLANILVRDDGVVLVNQNTANTAVAGAEARVALGWRVNDFAVTLNGGAVSVDPTGTIPTPTTLYMGKGDNSPDFILNSHLRKLQLYNPRPSNADLVTLSGGGTIAATPIADFDFTTEAGVNALTSQTYTEVQTLMGFILARQGAFDSFLFEDPTDHSVTDEPFGIGNGAVTAFQLSRSYGGFSEPVQNLNGPVVEIKADGVTVSPANYSVSATGGVTFTVAPLNGHRLTWTGRYYYRVRFQDDASDFSQFMKNLWELKRLAFVGSVLNKV